MQHFYQYKYYLKSTSPESILLTLISDFSDFFLLLKAISLIVYVPHVPNILLYQGHAYLKDIWGTFRMYQLYHPCHLLAAQN